MIGKLKYLIPLVIALYSFHLLFNVCPEINNTGFQKILIDKLTNSELKSLDQFNHFVCSKPHVALVSLKLIDFDNDYQISNTLNEHTSKLKIHWHSFDDKYDLSNQVNQAYTKSVDNIHSNLIPWLNYHYNELKLKSSHYYTIGLDFSQIYFDQFCIYSKSYYQDYIVNNWNKLNNSPEFQNFIKVAKIDYLIAFFKQFFNESNESFKEKLQFIKNEGKNLWKSTSDKHFKKIENNNIVDVVKDILDDVLETQEAKEPKEVADDEPNTVDEPDAVEENEPETDESEAGESGAEAETESGAEAESGAEVESEEAESDEAESEVEVEVEVEVESDYDSSDSTDEPLTIHLTSTITETSDSKETALENYDNKETDLESNTAEFRIDQELKFWDNKVTKTLNLSYDNLKSEMKPFLNSTMGEIIDIVSANLTKIQQRNYQYYKELGSMNSKIYKDVEYIKTYKEKVENPEVPRELVREVIKNAREYPPNELKKIEDLLNEYNSIILTKYFEVIQETIDILESFSEITVQDFANRLNTLLQILENSNDPTFSDDLSWKAWKRFHKVKDEIFKIRDKIYDDAIHFKEHPSSYTVIPNGLEDWISYLKNINFHIEFILHDNDEYLNLARAKANVAFQTREGYERELERLQAEEEKAKTENIEFPSSGFNDKMNGTHEEYDIDIVKDDGAEVQVEVEDPLVEEKEEDEREEEQDEEEEEEQEEIIEEVEEVEEAENEDEEAEEAEEAEEDKEAEDEEAQEAEEVNSDSDFEGVEVEVIEEDEDSTEETPESDAAESAQTTETDSTAEFDESDYAREAEYRARRNVIDLGKNNKGVPPTVEEMVRRQQQEKEAEKQKGEDIDGNDIDSLNDIDKI